MIRPGVVRSEEEDHSKSGDDTKDPNGGDPGEDIVGAQKGEEAREARDCTRGGARSEARSGR